MDVSPISVEFPYPGAVLNHQHGVETARGLTITVKGKADPGTAVVVNGVPAGRAGGAFAADIELTAQFNVIQVGAGGAQLSLPVVWDRRSFKRYYFFIDDNIFFLTEIYKKPTKSIFDQFYLAKLQALHERYGTKFVLNLFFRNDHDPFDLTQFPDRYKAEWKANAAWLKLAFHAYSEFPGHPYRDHFPDQLPEHYERLREQVFRFAGPDTFSPPSIIHYYEVASAAARRFLHASGTAALAIRNFPEAAKLGRTHAIYEADPGWFRMPVDFFCNGRSIPQIEEDLHRCMALPWKTAINIGTHEQYCYPYYASYIPDHFERMETAIKLVTANGYRPVFFHEGILGNVS